MDINKERAARLFDLYPDTRKAYRLSNQLFTIYLNTTNKGIAFTKLAGWYNEIELSGFKSFNIVMQTIQQHCESILNYFDNRIQMLLLNLLMLKLKLLELNLEALEI